MKKIVLNTESLIFYSSKDEAFFFAWVSKIDCVKSCRGSGAFLTIEIFDELLTISSWQELVAIFARFNLDFTLLNTLLNDDNAQKLKPKTPRYALNMIFGQQE